MEIIKANVDHVKLIAPLFDAYRQFYQQPSELQAVTEYINDRLTNDESTIFLALSNEQQPIGFTQLYPLFCSVEMIKIFVLYDLYVEPNGRGLGVGHALLDRAKIEAKQVGVDRIDLQTAQDNSTAQSLYKKFGYLYSNEFQNWTYYLKR